MDGLLERPDGSRALDVQADSVPVPAEALTALGLVVTELVSNAAKHGAGRITVALRQAATGLEVVVTDEGPGFGKDVGTGLGMRLIRSLAKGDPAVAVRFDHSVPFGRVTVLMTP